MTFGHATSAGAAPSLDELPTPDVAGRLGRLRERLAGAGCTALLVTKLENIRYLTGFSGSAGLLLVREDAALLCTDGRYRDQSREQVDAAGVEAAIHIGPISSQLGALADALRPGDLLGLEAADVSWARMRTFAERFERDDLVATSGVVEDLRAVKDEGEIARIERACAIADVALAQTKEMIVSGCTEAEFARQLDHEMRRRGSSGEAFETIVASGPNAALPHARPTERAIGRGELVVVDFGATVDGYRSDMTRLLCVGEPAGELGELAEAVLAAQRAGVHAVAVGVSGGAVDAACRDSLGEAGYRDAFTHSTGHGVGLEVHEAPSVSQESADILRAGTVVTVEPGAYLHGRGGARIEDTLVVTERGPRVLTKSTKDYTL